MGKPIINKINTFDATKESTITFSYSGNQPYKNRILITNASTNDIVFDETITTMKFIHRIPSSTLENNVSYTAQISVFDVEGNESSLSDKLFFTCYSTPTFGFNDLNSTSQNTISSNNYLATVSYSQEQSRQLKSYVFYLYDATKTNLITQSDMLYYSPGSDISYTYKSLNNNTLYYLKCIGITVDGVTVDTGFVKIYANYVVSNLYSEFTLTNHKAGGYIQGISNFKPIDGTVSGEYTIENGILNLPDGSVTYKDGFLINGGHLVGISIKNPKNNVCIFQESNGIDSIKLFHHIYESLHYFKLVAENELTNYVLYSDRIQMATNELITIYIERQENLYQLYIVRNTEENAASTEMEG